MVAQRKLYIKSEMIIVVKMEMFPRVGGCVLEVRVRDIEKDPTYMPFGSESFIC
jgi:hypothetical protein